MLGIRHDIDGTVGVQGGVVVGVGIVSPLKLSTHIKIKSVVFLVPVVSNDVPNLVIIFGIGSSCAVSPCVGSLLLEFNSPLSLFPTSIVEHYVLPTCISLVDCGSLRLHQTLGSKLDTVTHVQIYCRDIDIWCELLIDSSEQSLLSLVIE